MLVVGHAANEERSGCWMVTCLNVNNGQGSDVENDLCCGVWQHHSFHRPLSWELGCPEIIAQMMRATLAMTTREARQNCKRSIADRSAILTLSV